MKLDAGPRRAARVPSRAAVPRLLTLLVLLAIVAAYASAADVFDFYAPPGGVYANVSFEREETVRVDLTVEHDGVAIPDWFIAVSSGGSGTFSPREMSNGTDAMEYQVYGTIPPSAAILEEPPAVLSAANVVTSGDFASAVGSVELVTFPIYVNVASGQFLPSGDYHDTVTVSLYTGNYADSGTYALADAVSITITGRMAELIDLYADREPGIRSMDLTTSVSGKLIATVHERSNSGTGYTVTIASANLTADAGGATSPFFQNLDGPATLDYSLTYDGAAVSPWSGGSVLVVDSTGTTAPEWVSRELRISYAGSPSLAAGDYEDRIIITISAK